MNLASANDATTGWDVLSLLILVGGWVVVMWFLNRD